MKNTIIIFLMFFLVVPPVMSQDNDYFYYYNGQKNYLQIDSTSVMVLSNDSITMSKRHGLSLKWMTRNDLSEFSGNDRQRSISTRSRFSIYLRILVRMIIILSSKNLRRLKALRMYCLHLEGTVVE